MKQIDFRLVLTNAIFKLVPTILITLYLWLTYSASISELHRDMWLDVSIFSGGMLIAYFLYAYQIRFSITFGILVAALYGTYKYLGDAGGSEFDSFYYAIAFSIYATVFLGGWLVGFGFARFSWFPWLAAIAVFFVAVSVVVSDFLNVATQMNAAYIQQTTQMVFQKDGINLRFITMLFLMMVPVLFYSVFIVSVNEFLRKMYTFDQKKIRFLMKRSVQATAILLGILTLQALYVHYFGLPDWLKSQLVQAEVNSASFLKKTYDSEGGGSSSNKPQFDLQKYAQLLPKVQLSDETVFCTYIDNFFPTQDGGKIPLPVHFRRFVLNRYEPANERFVLDPYPPSAIPNDLFSPSVKDVPIGFSIGDSLIEASTGAYGYRKNIASTVYIQSLAPNAYVAPNTGYTYQKLPVPPEDKDTFTAVYQCSSLISIWNLPPFMFSSNEPELLEFKKLREDKLNLDRNYSDLDSAFMDYYTQLDTQDSLVLNLSKQLTANAKTPFQKVQAISDYFLGNDELGKKRFTYTLEPGLPTDPDQSMMHYFLFDNKRGYCTYFAGATTLLLRAAGIPCRVVVGYAIHDRSNKNSGWYWVYANQGHAWLEVYFPSYGWVDFDTTPSDDNATISPPKPDATPPDYARAPVFAAIGKVAGISADSTTVLVKPYSIRYRSKKYEIPEDEAELIAIKPNGGVVKVDEKAVPIGEFDLEKEMLISTYSFNYDLEKSRPYKSKKSFMKWFMRRFPKEIPVDEAIIVYKEDPSDDGKIFAVDGQIQSILPDSSGLTILPEKVFFRGKNYTIEKKYAQPVNIRPKDALVYVDGKKVPVSDFIKNDSLTVVDSIFVKAESADLRLQQIKPFLATESFTAWFKNRFPEMIPVDRAEIQVEHPPLSEAVFSAVLYGILIGLITLFLLAWLVYFYFSWRFGMAKDQQKLYWLYRLSLMTLNQFGFSRTVKTPLEYAQKTIDPKFGTQMGQFLNLYQQSKYAPSGMQLSSAEMQFVSEYQSQFKERVFGAFSVWQVLGNFTNFIRTLRFLLLAK